MQHRIALVVLVSMALGSGASADERPLGQGQGRGTRPGPAPTAPRPAAPEWPGPTNDSFWPVEGGYRDDLRLRMRLLSDAEVDTVLERFCFLVVTQLRAQVAADTEITMEMLVTELVSRWVRETPYKSNADSAYRSVKAIGRGANDYRLIVRRGWGICGDYQLLVKRLAEVAVGFEGARHLAPELPRLQVLGVRGEGRFDASPLEATHGAVGLASRELWAAAQRNTPAGADSIRWPFPVDRFDILVYDLWLRPPVTGTIRAGEWAVNSIQNQWKAIVGLARPKLYMYWGEIGSWELSW